MKGFEELTALIKKVQATGIIDTSEKAIIEYQDMIGHSAIEQLQELSRGRYTETFYRVYGHAYGTIEAIKFYRDHSTWSYNLQAERADYKADRDDWERKAHTAEETAKKYNELFHEENQKALALKKTAERQEKEIIVLKAKLYDLMQAGQ